MTHAAQLRVEGMHCPSCPMLIDEELEDMDGVIESSTSLTKRSTNVQFDASRIDLARIVAAIQQLGYTATVTT